MVECIHCNTTGSVVQPENHDHDYNKAFCEDCEKYQVESGEKLLGSRFGI